MKHKVWSIIKTTLVSGLLLIILTCCIALYGRLIQGKDTIGAFGYSFYVVTSGSMEPEIHVGDLVVVRQCGASECVPGDVITFQDENQNTVTHRLQEKQGEKLVTRGDANNTADLPVEPDQVKGKVVAVVRSAGWLLGFFSNRPGRIMLLVTGVFLLRFQLGQTGRESYEEEGEEG